MSIIQDYYGTAADGKAVDRFTLCNHRGTIVRIISYGATVTELHVPDQSGQLDDVVLGCDTLRSYETESPYFGCVVGRMAFRTAEGRFDLDGVAYQLTPNDGRNHLHGGQNGLNNVVWQAEVLERSDAPTVRLSYDSPDGEEGYPGNLHVIAEFTLSEQNELKIDFTAKSDKRTPVNLTHHGYFNLAGEGNVLGNELLLKASRYLPADEAGISTGKIHSVEGTPLDFRRPTSIGARFDETGGYDLCYLLDRPDEGLGTTVADLYEPGTGRSMQVRTTAPAIVLYTGNYLDGELIGKRGAVYRRHAGVCLETGHPPDAVNHAEFPLTIAGPDEPYRQTTVYHFTVR